MPVEVTDVRSNPQDQIAHAVRVIGRSEDRMMVFLAIYKGKKKAKTVSEVAKLASLPGKADPRIRVLQEAGVLCGNRIAKKTKIGIELAYEKDSFYAQNKKTIMRLVNNREALTRFPTKTNPTLRLGSIHVSFPRHLVRARQITIDDIGSFSRVRGHPSNLALHPVKESMFKEGLKTVLGEKGTFQDWGGETDDLFSTRLVIRRERKSVAFGLKGRGTTGILTPRKMGKRGDQIQRLFRAPADVFIVQYGGQIDESIIEQMKYMAIAKSVSEQREIYFGVIDGQDTLRIIGSYPDFFRAKHPLKVGQANVRAIGQEAR